MPPSPTWSGWPWRGWRVGEAANPGPAGRIRILSANVTRWSSAWRGLLAADADVWCVQEARVAPKDAAGAVAAAARRGYALQLGMPAEAQGSLLAVAHRRPGVAGRAEPMRGVSGDAAPRLQHLAVHLGRKDALHVVNVYGYTGGARVAELNEMLLLEAVAWLQSLGDIPALIVGDLNLRLEGCGIDGALAMAGWTDLLGRAGATCMPSHGTPSRIDYVLASRRATQMVETAELRWDLGLATHAALLVELRCDPPEQAWMRQVPVPLDGPDGVGWAGRRRGEEARLLARHAPAFRTALSAGDLDGAWGRLAAAMEEWHWARTGAGGSPRQHAAARWQAERPRARGGAGEAADRAADGALLRCRRLRSLASAVGAQPAVAGSGNAAWPDAPLAAIAMPAQLPRRAERILDALQAAEGERSPWLARLAALRRAPRSEVAGAIEQAEREAADAAAAARQRRRDRWHGWVSDALANGAGRLYRWIRSDGTMAVDMVPDPAADGAGAAGGSRRWARALRGGPAAQLRHLESHWRPLWQREVGPAPPADWAAELDGLPPFPERAPWTVQLLKAVLAAMARGKAPGLDGWRVAELRLLPDSLLQWLADLLEEVERGGAWPAALRQPEGLLLPKAGAADPGDPTERRPIWLLPMAYRVWAAGRAKAFAAWCASWDGVADQSAEQLAWELALELEVAEATGEELAGAALDWSKAFDRVPLCHAEALLRRAGVPQWLLRPMMGAYCAPRRLRVAGALGGEWLPSSGILPGCSLAVFVLKVLIRPWDRRIGRAVAGLQRRAYVDDLTFWKRGGESRPEEAVVAGLAVTRQFEAAMDWSLNAGKCRQFASSAEARRWLRARAPEVPVAIAVKDLGVMAVAGPALRAPVAPARVRAAAGRFRRLGRLPVPFDARCRMGAAAGTAAGVFGASCGAPPARDLELLRRAAKTAACHGGFRAAAEVVFGVLSATWRLDPKAVVVVAPVLQAVRALRRGRIAADCLAWAAEVATRAGGRREGPLSAAVRGLSLLGLGADLLQWSGVPGHPGGWDPTLRPERESLAVLLAAWRRAEWRAVASRRADMAHLAGGLDEWATRRLLGSGALAPDAAGALRAVLAGGVVTERVAARWSGAGAGCPHCQGGAEDAEHRHWRCLAWAAVREEAAGPGGSAALRARLSDGVAHTGLLPLPADLAALLKAAEEEDPGFPDRDAALPAGGRWLVYTDGACADPTDPLLARAAWGLHLPAQRGLAARGAAGPVQGRQTAQRGELSAVVAACRLLAGAADVVSDSRYVVDGVAGLAAGADPREWRHADLWEVLLGPARARTLTARWVPAHKDAEDYAERGLAEEDRRGNCVADSWASAAAAARTAPAGHRAARGQQLADLERAQRVLAATELAALRADHAGRPHAGPRVRRRWADVRRGAGRGRRPVQAPAPAGPEPSARPPGPPPAPLHDLRRDTSGLGCEACGRRGAPGRWGSLAYGRCPANGPEAAGAEVQWRRVPHCIVEAEGWLRCTRCGGRVPTLRRAAFQGRRCPAWRADPGGWGAEGGGGAGAGQDWGCWHFELLGRPAAGARGRPPTPRASGTGLGSGRPPRAGPCGGGREAAVAARALFAGAAWVPHVAIAAPRAVACMRCGRAAPAWEALAASPCPGWVPVLPPRWALLLLAGAALQRAGGPEAVLREAVERRRSELPAAPD